MATRKRTPGSGSVFKDGNGIWHFRKELGKDPATGKRRIIQAKGHTKAEARERYEAKLAEMERTGLLPGSKSPYLVDYADRWLADYRTRVKPTTYRTRAGRIKACTDVIGHVRLKDITPEHIRHCMRVLGERLASSTLKDHYVSLKMVLDQAELEELIPIDPCRRVKPPRVERSQTRILDEEQPGRLIAAVADTKTARRGPADMDDMTETWMLLFELAFAAGMREGERYALMPYELERRDGVQASTCSSRSNLMACPTRPSSRTGLTRATCTASCGSPRPRPVPRTVSCRSAKACGRACGRASTDSTSHPTASSSRTSGAIRYAKPPKPTIGARHCRRPDCHRSGSTAPAIGPRP